MVAGAVSNCRVPWLETITPEAPCLTASKASSERRTPFTSTGSFVIPTSHSISFQANAGSKREAMQGASAEPAATSGKSSGPAGRRFFTEWSSGNLKLISNVAFAPAQHWHIDRKDDGLTAGNFGTFYQRCADCPILKDVELKPDRSGRDRHDFLDRKC